MGLLGFSWVFLPRSATLAVITGRSSDDAVSLTSFRASIPRVPVTVPASTFLDTKTSLVPSPMATAALPYSLDDLAVLVLALNILHTVALVYNGVLRDSSSLVSSVSLTSDTALPSPDGSDSLTVTRTIVVLSPMEVLAPAPTLQRRLATSWASTQDKSRVTAGPSGAVLLSVYIYSFSSSWSHVPSDFLYTGTVAHVTFSSTFIVTTSTFFHSSPLVPRVTDARSKLPLA